MDVKKKNKIYENQQIGNFNVLMGYTLGEAGYRRPFSINTFQQVYRHDKVVGDFFAHVGGKYFIIEFKKSFSEYRKEGYKPQRDHLFSQLIFASKMDEISRKGHFLCYGDVSNTKDGPQLDYHLIPYSELKKELHETDFIQINVRDFTLNLINKTISDPFNIGMSHHELVDYIKLLKKCADTSGTGGYETSGIIACFDEKKGMISVPFQGFSELELLLEQSNSHEQNKKLGKDRSKGFWKSNDKGMEI